MEALLRRLPVWIAVSAMVAVAGWIVAQTTDDNTAPFDDGVVATVAWAAFVIGGLMFVVLCVIAGVRAWYRQHLAERS
jgi:hypothetical protein